MQELIKIHNGIFPKISMIIKDQIPSRNKWNFSNINTHYYTDPLVTRHIQDTT